MNYAEAVVVANKISQKVPVTIDEVNEALDACATAIFYAEMCDDYSVTRKERAEIAPYQKVLKDYKDQKDSEKDEQEKEGKENE